MLDAPSTLVNDEYLENGVREIEQAYSIKPIVKLLTTGCTGEQEKAV